MQVAVLATDSAQVLFPDTLAAVDRVRLGRALGYGTRHLARTLAAVAEAAAAPGPDDGANRTSAKPAAVPDTGTKPRLAPKPVPDPVLELPPRPATTSRRASEAPATASTSHSRTGHLRRSFLQPLAVYSAALWLRVTGTFFALLAVTMGGGAWRVRNDLRAPAGAPFAGHFWVFCLFTGLFGYFAISSFVRASLRERRAGSQR